MSDEAASQRSVDYYQNEILQLESFKIAIEKKLVNARIGLFEAQGGKLSFQPDTIDLQLDAFLDALQKQRIAGLPKVPEEQLPESPPVTTTPPTTPPRSHQENRPKINQVGDHTSFLTLNISTSKFREFAQKQNLPPANSVSAQGPGCEDHPRWNTGSSVQHQDTKPPVQPLGPAHQSNQGPAVGTTAKADTATSQAFPHLQDGHTATGNMVRQPESSPRGQEKQLVPVTKIQPQVIPPPPTSIGSGSAARPPTRNTTTSAPSRGSNSAGTPTFEVLAQMSPQPQTTTGNGFDNNAFLQLAANNGLLLNQTENPPQMNRIRRPQQQSTFPLTNQNIPWQGMKKKVKKNDSQSTQVSPVSGNNRTPSTIPQKRAATIAYDPRPPQRPRLDPINRIATPPLNSGREIDENYDEDEEEEGSEDEQVQKRQSPQQPIHRGATLNQSSLSTIPVPVPRQRTRKNAISYPHNSRPPQSLSQDHADHDAFRNNMPSTADDSSIFFPSNDDDQSQVVTNKNRRECVSLEPELDPDQEQLARRYRRNMRARVRRQPDYFKTRTHNPLNTKERTNLELRFCARVAMIIASKICVSMAPIPYDSNTIWENLKCRFRATEDEPFTDEHYRTQADFAADAKRMLDQYVALGHCKDCPFLKSGNARVMCYRIRLQSIVEDRLRQLRDAIITCEFETEKEDHAARCKIIDEWFWEEDFEADNHWTGN